MKDPKGPPQACLFVASISEETNEETLLDFFSGFGQILKIKLLKDRASRPYAFVQFLNVEEADVALAQTNGNQLDNRRIRVEKAKVNRTLFLAKLPRPMSNNQLREVMEEYGPVESVTIIKNHQTNKSKGCGFVKFVYREDAKEAFVGLKNKHRKWVVEWATSTNDPDLLGVDKNNIFIGGLNPTSIDKELLETRFSSYGEIESLTLINRAATEAPLEEEEKTDQAPRSAFAFVRYKDANHAASAIENENGAEWLDRRIRVQYCESPEMKIKRRASKYYIMNPQLNMYYPGVAIPPLVMMGGIPMYTGTDKYPEIYGNPYATPYPMYPYTPWMFAPYGDGETYDVEDIEGNRGSPDVDNVASSLSTMNLSSGVPMYLW